MKRSFLKWGSFLILVLFCCSFFGCAKKAAENQYAPNDESVLEKNTKTYTNNSNTDVTSSDRKVAVTAEFVLETNSFDGFVSSLNDQVTALNGYTVSSRIYSEKSSSQNGSAQLTVKIPKEQYTVFVAFLKQNANVVLQRENSEDVTKQISDAKATETALKTTEERLLELLKKAESLQDILTLEEKLKDIRTQLEILAADLSNLNNRVAYVTANLSIEDVKEYTQSENSFWNGIQTSFSTSIKSLAFLAKGASYVFVFLLPYLVIFGIIAVAVFGILKTVKNKKKK